MAKTGKILIVDDDPLVLQALNQTFLDDYDVVMAASGPEALQALDKHGDLDTVVLDIKMARMDGLATACRIREINPELPVIFHTGYPGDYSEREIDAEHQPFDYVGKNERPARLQRTVRNAVFMHRLKTSSSDLIELARREYGMVGRSRLMRDVYQKIEKIGPTDNKVMILGPTGAGKELVARAIHRRSRRSEARRWPFSTATTKRPIWSKANCSDICVDRSPGRSPTGSGCLNTPTVGPFFSTRSATWTSPLRANC